MSLKEQSFQDFEVIVVDQNPHDTLKDYLTLELNDINLIYLHVKKSIGLSAARNHGLEYAKGKIVAFPDDDCWYQKDTLDKVHQYFEANDSISCITGLVTDTDGSFSAGGYMLRNKKVQVSNRNVWWCSNSSAIFIKQEILKEIGVFDTNVGLGSQRYISSEETDLVIRIHQQDFIIQYFPDVNIYHKRYRGTYNAKEIRKGYGYGLGMGYILRKNHYNFIQLMFYSGIHAAKGSLFLLTFRYRRGIFHFAQSLGRLRGWLEYPREAKKQAIT